VVLQRSAASAPMANTNSRMVRRCSVPSLRAQQAHSAGLSESGLPHTPAASCLGSRRLRRQVVEVGRLRCLGASRCKGLRRAPSKSGVASLLGSRPLVRLSVATCRARALASVK
jgi:hypothetical protein